MQEEEGRVREGKRQIKKGRRWEMGKKRKEKAMREASRVEGEGERKKKEENEEGND